MGDLSSDEEERLLRMDLMRADIDLKRAQARSEPWKAIAATITACAAVFGALGAIVGYALATALAHH
jgi:hypothetical protein